MAFDPDAFLAKEDKKETVEETPTAKTEGFNVDSFLAKEDVKEQAQPVEEKLDQATGPVAPSEGSIVGAVAPATTAYGYNSPTGLKDLGRAVQAGAGPYLQAAKEGLGKTAEIYKARPIVAPAIDIAGTALFGAPPIATAQQAMGAWDKFNAAKEGVQGVGQVLSEGAPTTTPVRGLPTTETKAPFAEMKNAAGNPELSKKLSSLWNDGAGNNSVRTWLNSAEGRAAQAANPEFAAKAAAYLEKVPSYGTQAMKVVSPILKGAARVAGPLGMAANLYEAQPYLAEAGPEASSGRAQNRIAEAQRMMLNRPTPAPLTPTEASNLLQSDDQRTINIYGGRAHLEELVKSGLRQKAASKILGPVAPGQ